MARDRLARRIRTDVADVRVRLEEATLRSDALLATGQPERAAAVLQEQQALLAELRETVSSSVAAAMAEAEAEAVLAGSPDGTTLFGDPAGHEVPAPRRTFRSTASALVSAVAALAVLLVAAPAPPPDTLAASDRQDGAGLPDGASTVGAPDVAEADLVAGDEPGAGPTEIELRRLFGARAPSTSGGNDGAGGSGLSQFQALVDQFVATVVRAAGGLTPATLPILRIDDADRAAPPARSAGAADDGDVGTAGDEQPATEPAAEDRRPEDGAEEPPPAEDDPEEEPGVELPSADGNATVPGLARPE
ncbi:MAG: hypothetical protein KY457_11340 [Actinobacteria bacterium]|nr:hypothetical protein [Actinomycetota bacterium]